MQAPADVSPVSMLARIMLLLALTFGVIAVAVVATDPAGDTGCGGG